MTEFTVFHEYAKELEDRIRLQTYPLAVKMLEKESDIPDDAQKPMRDFGYRLSSCQGFAMSRREATVMATTLEDMWCPEAAVGFGLVEPTSYYFEGRHRFPQTVERLEAGSIWAHEFPRLETNKYIGIVSAPLNTVNFEPDVVIIYCDAAQLGTFLLAAASKEGRELTCTVGAKGACVYAVVAPMQRGNYQVTVPCPGDRRRAAAQPNEMIFSVPVGKMEDLLASLRYLEPYRYQLPFRYIMQSQGQLFPNYAEMGREMGMNWLK
jgi:uncharacterized protein (DUF169 family)